MQCCDNQDTIDQDGGAVMILLYSARYLQMSFPTTQMRSFPA
jgi:hypothetical protein